jgi:hypothetical protein
MSVSGYRSGHYVYVRAHVTRFNRNLDFGLGGWQNSAGRNVQFSEYIHGWRLAGSKSTGSNGWTAYLRIYAPTRRSFRAYVSATTTFAAALSSSISR